MADDASAPVPAAAPDPLHAAEAALQEAEAESCSRGARIDAAVTAWLDQQLRNSPVSRSTEAWNHLTAALPALVAALKEI